MRFDIREVAAKVQDIVQSSSPTIITDITERLEDLSISELVDLYIAVRKENGIYTDRTATYLLNATNNAIRTVGNIPVRDVRHSDVWSAIRKEERYTVLQRNDMLRYLRQVLVYFHKRGMLPWSPDSGSTLPYYSPPKRIPTLEELGMLYEGVFKAYPQSNSTNRRISTKLRAWIVTQYFYGFRFSAMQELRICHFNHHHIQIRVPKTNMVHTVPMHSVVLRHLMLHTDCDGILFKPFRKAVANPRRELTDKEEAQKIFRGVSSKMINKWLLNACKAGGVDWNMTTHALRRASLEQWDTVSTGCMATIHGSGIPMILNRYRSGEAKLRRGIMRLPIPPEWLTHTQREADTLAREEWVGLFDVLSAHERQALLTVLEAMTNVDD